MGLDETCHETLCPDTALRNSPAGLMTAHHSEQHKALSSGPIIAKVIVEDLLFGIESGSWAIRKYPMLAGRARQNYPPECQLWVGSDHLQFACGHISLDKQVGEERLSQ